MSNMADARYGVEIKVRWHSSFGWSWSLLAVSATPNAPPEDWSGNVRSADEAWTRAKSKARELGFDVETESP